jgi:hypothetical protein
MAAVLTGAFMLTGPRGEEEEEQRLCMHEIKTPRVFLGS